MFEFPKKGSPEVAALPGGAVRVGRNDGDRDRHGRLEQLHHLLVGERRHRVLVDLKKHLSNIPIRIF